jgi:hypothetical protein
MAKSTTAIVQQEDVDQAKILFLLVGVTGLEPVTR